MIAFYHPTDIAIARPVAGLFVGLCTRVTPVRMRNCIKGFMARMTHEPH